MTGSRKRLGELVLRSTNAQALVEFYRDVIGLEPYATLGRATFLKVDDDFEGHPQLLAYLRNHMNLAARKRFNLTLPRRESARCTILPLCLINTISILKETGCRGSVPNLSLQSMRSLVGVPFTCTSPMEILSSWYATTHLSSTRWRINRFGSLTQV